MRWVLYLSPVLALAQQFHRAEQDRDIRYLLLEPATHQFFISHDFNVERAGQKSVHSFVRKGSQVSPDSKMFLLDTGEALATHLVTGKAVNALGYYPQPSDPDGVVVQGDLPRAVEEGQSFRVRVEETYTDPVGYKVDGKELVWTRTLGRPLNFVTLPDGWMLTSVNVPAVITMDEKGRVRLRFTNPRNGDIAVTIRARRGYGAYEPCFAAVDFRPRGGFVRLDQRTIAPSRRADRCHPVRHEASRRPLRRRDGDFNNH